MIFLFFSFLLVVAAEKPWGHFMLRVLPLKSKCHCWWLHKRTGENVKVHCISWFLFLAVNPVTFITAFRLSFLFPFTFPSLHSNNIPNISQVAQIFLWCHWFVKLLLSQVVLWDISAYVTCLQGTQPSGTHSSDNKDTFVSIHI